MCHTKASRAEAVCQALEKAELNEHLWPSEEPEEPEMFKPKLEAYVLLTSTESFSGNEVAKCYQKGEEQGHPVAVMRMVELNSDLRFVKAALPGGASSTVILAVFQPLHGKGTPTRLVSDQLDGVDEEYNPPATLGPWMSLNPWYGIAFEWGETVVGLKTEVCVQELVKLDVSKISKHLYDSFCTLLRQEETFIATVSSPGICKVLCYGSYDGCHREDQCRKHQVQCKEQVLFDNLVQYSNRDLELVRNALHLIHCQHGMYLCTWDAPGPDGAAGKARSFGWVKEISLHHEIVQPATDWTDFVCTSSHFE